MADLTVEDYSEKCIVVRGNTKGHKDALKELGGKYNPRLKNGPGWIFPKSDEKDVYGYMSSGKTSFFTQKMEFLNECKELLELEKASDEIIESLIRLCENDIVNNSSSKVFSKTSKDFVQKNPKYHKEIVYEVCKLITYV